MARLILMAVMLCALASLSTSMTLVSDFQGDTFFDNFDFWSAPDPTHGYVYYTTEAQAKEWNYTFVSGNKVYIYSDHTSIASGSGRGSVRISSRKTYDSGLFLFDIEHMPIGCGNWPAVWTCGPNWPNEGEIDVIEGVNKQQVNRQTLHSKAGCSMTNVARNQTGHTNTVDCNSLVNGNQGCSVDDTRTTSFGVGYNNNRGGVHALWWTSSFIQVFFFPRNAIPSDITSGSPNPSSWGAPVGDWPLGSNCPATNFQNHQIIVDNTFCGDWAGNTFNSDGCSGSCTSFVQNNPKSFTEAYWGINSFKVYM
eukprot:TRINITY_DN2403_c0_g3_i1.p1 TRINITY_DN2403_c0_g3~~TRINITY_DN2403_c0_g3_i1.p1  ORF type:complete len:309 (+),score=36.22 TRINITY_DN2403_c0_g3_i1:171-1097(+)